MPWVDVPDDQSPPPATTAAPPPGGGWTDLPPDAQPDAPQLQGFWRYPAMAASSVAKGALQGAGLLGDIENAGSNLMGKYLHDPLYRAITGQNPPGAGYQSDNPLSSSNLVAGGQALGAVNRPDLQPQTPGEKYTAAIGEGAGGAIPYLWMGGGPGVTGAASTLGRTALNYGRQILGGAAGGGAGEYLAQNWLQNYPTLARILGGVAGGLGVAGAPLAGPTAVAQAMDRLGIPTNLAGDVTGSRIAGTIQRIGADMPGGGAIATAQENAVRGFGDAVENTASQMGASTTAQQAGTALQQASQNWLSAFKQRSQQLYNDLDMHIPANTPQPVTRYASTLNAVRDQMPGAPATAGVLQPQLSGDLFDALIADTQAGPLTYGTVRGIRTRIGQMLSDNNLIGDTNYGDLKRIYAALSSDIGDTAQNFGPAAQNAYNAASAFTRNGHQYIDNTLSNFIGKPGAISPEQAYTAATSGANQGGTTLQAVRDEMPTAANEIGAFKLRDMAQATPGVRPATAAQGPLVSPTTFVTNLNKMSPEANDALFGSPLISSQLDDLRTSAGAMRETARQINTSGTGRYGALRDMLTSPLTAATAAGAGWEAAGIPGAVAGATAGLLGPWVPGALAARMTLRAPRNYSGLLGQPLISQYGGATAPPQGMSYSYTPPGQ